jgi:hypothetical protein
MCSPARRSTSSSASSSRLLESVIEVVPTNDAVELRESQRPAREAGSRSRVVPQRTQPVDRLLATVHHCLT